MEIEASSEKALLQFTKSLGLDPSTASPHGASDALHKIYGIPKHEDRMDDAIPYLFENTETKFNKLIKKNKNLFKRILLQQRGKLT